jgi:hypothetical protein
MSMAGLRHDSRVSALHIAGFAVERSFIEGWSVILRCLWR